MSAIVTNIYSKPNFDSIGKFMEPYKDNVYYLLKQYFDMNVMTTIVNCPEPDYPPGNKNIIY